MSGPSTKRTTTRTRRRTRRRTQVESSYLPIPVYPLPKSQCTLSVLQREGTPTMSSFVSRDLRPCRARSSSSAYRKVNTDIYPSISIVFSGTASIPQKAIACPACQTGGIHVHHRPTPMGCWMFASHPHPGQAMASRGPLDAARSDQPARASNNHGRGSGRRPAVPLVAGSRCQNGQGSINLSLAVPSLSPCVAARQSPLHVSHHPRSTFRGTSMSLPSWASDAAQPS